MPKSEVERHCNSVESKYRMPLCHDEQLFDEQEGDRKHWRHLGLDRVAGPGYHPDFEILTKADAGCHLFPKPLLKLRNLTTQVGVRW